MMHLVMSVFFQGKASLDEQPCDNNGVTPSVLGIVGTMMVSAH